MRNTKSGDADLDWALLFQAFTDSFEWALDAAAGFARNYPEEVAAVERVRAFMRKHVAGQTAHVRIDDVLFTFGLLMGVIERDLAPSRTDRATSLVRAALMHHRLPAKRSPSRGAPHELFVERNRSARSLRSLRIERARGVRDEGVARACGGGSFAEVAGVMCGVASPLA
jgi:hypothetical protein